jgi:energy-coupling factor transporter ATP-binding protein EcfA2
MSRMILPLDSDLYHICRHAVRKKKMVFLIGLPGTGKSLLLQQLALLAHENGRTVHQLQWDVARLAFETPALLKKYPEIDGVTHAAIRKMVGLWARQGIANWQQQFVGDAHILIGELPLIGNRLIELVQLLDDEAELLLRSKTSLFLLPVPSPEVRRHIQEARRRTFTNPQHEKERKDAPPDLMMQLWRELVRVSYQLGLAAAAPVGNPDYDPALYTAVFSHLLQHRPQQLLPIEIILRPSASAYDLQINASELGASTAEVNALTNTIEKKYTPETLQKAVAQWYLI